MNEDPTLTLNAGQPLAEVPSAPTAWGGFSLLARLGHGGFGEVYRAWDSHLRREVALKLLLPGVSGNDAEYESMLSEARALAAVRHPNIVHVYGIDRHDGRVGFWTDYIKGKTLAALLAEQGPFGCRETALIAMDVTKALSAVHRAGILHRDIKAENVMREEGGRILLMDFGLSSLPQAQRMLAGTPHSMAPELFSGRDASVASDIYAMGVLLYFLVSGAYPVKLAGYSPAEIDEAFTKRKTLLDLRPDLPESFLRTVRTAMQIDPAKRYASAGELAVALGESLGAFVAPEVPAAQAAGKHAWRKYAIAAILLLSVFGGRLVRSVRGLFSPAGSAAAANDTSDYQIAEELLSKSYQNANTARAVKHFEAIPETDNNYALARAGLGSAYFIQYRGSRDPRLLELSEAATRRAIQANPALAPPYVTQARIAAMQGHTAEAMQYAQKATSLDPRSADAHRAMAEVYDAQGRKPDALAEMQKAEDLAPEDWRWPLNLGNYYFAAGNLDKAAEKYKRSAELAPGNATAYYDLGMVDMRMNRINPAKAEFERSIKIEDAADREQMLGEVLMAQGDYAGGLAAEQKASRLAPDDYSIWGDIGKAHLARGNRAEGEAAYRKAIDTAESALKREPKDAVLLAMLAHYHALLGDSSRSMLLLRQALALSGDDADVNYTVGATCELLHQRPRAMELIAKALVTGHRTAEFERDPLLASLREDLRWPQMLRDAKSQIGVDTSSKMD